MLSALSFACGDQERWPFKIIILLDSLGKFQSGIAAKVNNLFIFTDSCNRDEESLIEKLQCFLNGVFDPISQRGLICVDLADIHAVIQGTGQHNCETFTFDLAQIESLWERVRKKLQNHLGIASLYLYFSVDMNATLSLLVEADKFLDSIFPEATTTIAIQKNPDVVNKEGCKLAIYLSQHKVNVCDDDKVFSMVNKLLSEAVFNFS